MPMSNRDGSAIAYEIQGAPSAPALVLIAGVCTPRDGWPDGFCRQLANAGIRVIRFDHRDTGESDHLDHLAVPDLAALASDSSGESIVDLPYTLAEMVGDVVGVLDAVGIDRTHVCGISMGGMIGQILALEHADRVISLVSMASTTGASDLPSATAEAREALMAVPPADRDGYLCAMVDIQEAFSGGSSLFDPVVQREMSVRVLDRGGSPAAFARHMAAIQMAPERREALGALERPTLVVHGRRDPLFSLDHGRDTATHIPDSFFHVIDDWGHGMAYPALWPEMVQVISDHVHAHDLDFKG